MADVSGPALQRSTFSVETDVLPDILLRLLGPFAVQGASLETVRHGLTGGGALTIIETRSLDPRRAELLTRRIAQMPWVRSVALALDPAQGEPVQIGGPAGEFAEGEMSCGYG